MAQNWIDWPVTGSHSPQRPCYSPSPCPPQCHHSIHHPLCCKILGWTPRRGNICRPDRARDLVGGNSTDNQSIPHGLAFPPPRDVFFFFSFFFSFFFFFFFFSFFRLSGFFDVPPNSSLASTCPPLFPLCTAVSVMDEMTYRPQESDRSIQCDPISPLSDIHHCLIQPQCNDESRFPSDRLCKPCYAMPVTRHMGSRGSASRVIGRGLANRMPSKRHVFVYFTFFYTFLPLPFRLLFITPSLTSLHVILLLVCRAM